MFKFLSGYKTYIVAAGAILTALGAYATGEMSLTEFGAAAFAAVGAMTMRAGIAKAGQ